MKALCFGAVCPKSPKNVDKCSRRLQPASERAQPAARPARPYARRRQSVHSGRNAGNPRLRAGMRCRQGAQQPPGQLGQGLQVAPGELGQRRLQRMTQPSLPTRQQRDSTPMQARGLAATTASPVRRQSEHHRRRRTWEERHPEHRGQGRRRHHGPLGLRQVE